MAWGPPSNLLSCSRKTVGNVRIIKKNEMGGSCGTYGGRGEVHTGFWWEDLREGDDLEDLGVVGRIILKWIFKK